MGLLFLCLRGIDKCLDRVYNTGVNGKEVRELRLSLGWSQDKMAKETGYTTTTISRWERGIVTPSPVAELILEALKESLVKPPV